MPEELWRHPRDASGCYPRYRVCRPTQSATEGRGTEQRSETQNSKKIPCPSIVQDREKLGKI
eukprot:3200711-Amphidinium_carterae.1